ncbi:MAG: prolyl oligopeptidase family serine peptidase [Gammaproteobacteria bacterium]|nr:prolyl oligopeptidase family serine peptidase [Gammaproteobacteria bacterium]
MFVLFFVLLTACGPEADKFVAHRGALLEQTELATIPVAAADAMMSAYTSYGLAGLNAAYDVTAYKIVYSTPDADGNLVSVSGLITAPVKDPGATSPLISLQHGTLFLNKAPSSMAGGAETAPEVSYADIAVMFASQGYVVAAANYIGYGDTSGVMHPFIHARTLASTTVDMLHATATLATRNQLKLNGQLFLAGYSEGGYATLAAQRSLENDFAVEFPITASAPAAGPFDMSTTAMAIVASTSLPVPAYVGFVLKAYDTAYNFNRIPDYFQAPYVDAINNSFDGTLNKEEINALLTTVTADLFNPAFRADFLGSGEGPLKSAIAENDIYNWAPVTMTRFFHGPDDVSVPYFNTPLAVASMQANGAADVDSVDCYLGGLPTTHSNCFFPYFTYANSLFSTMATDL